MTKLIDKKFKVEEVPSFKRPIKRKTSYTFSQRHERSSKKVEQKVVKSEALRGAKKKPESKLSKMKLYFEEWKTIPKIRRHLRQLLKKRRKNDKR